ncbi:hydrolase, alpha/beta fold family protein [Aspergillus vadensis CBS 113365]|uniref:Hydrolase, alpha/beta fold family protein n=1 Tax=Aspergillus vadensis (strain CBS 113365 / IMI 142717 / IBT 24658) TaxID=1448311 RepID=A0A319AWY4_ASPVC|nr:hydrolase, alpha/beta fold family protein [Aspergillus vadensis CBS 113365]PYH64867.1 hydrolase, alpha/beta fold family protein [Aspergillus vadensis CBS 113365]
MATMNRAEDPLASKSDGAPFHSPPSLPRHHRSIPSRTQLSDPSATAVDPASPEVISSLISSLSTISVPLQSHFDNIPRIDTETNPSAPVYIPTGQSPSLDQRQPSEHDLSVRNRTRQASEEALQTPFLHPDDAAAPPIIRMARAPPSPKHKATFDPPLSPGRPTSRGSYTSSKAAYEDTAFGTITTEPGPRVSTANSVASSGSRKSLRNQFGLLKRPSREFCSDKDRKTERLRKTCSFNDGLRHNIPRSRASIRSLCSMADVVEETRPVRAATEPSREPTFSRPSSKERHSLQSARDSAPSTPGGIGSGRVIPARESSLRHSFSSSPKHRRSTRHSRYSSTSSREMKVDSAVSGVGNEAEQVTKRIQELKDQQQKIKSELEIDDTPEKPSKPGPAVASAREMQNASASSETMEHRQIVRQANGGFDESAPAPAVMTGKSRSSLASKSISNPPPSLERFDQLARYRGPMEQSTSAFTHKRSPSGSATPVGVSSGEERPTSADSIDLAVYDYISSPKLTQKVSHPTSGRTIAFSEVGDPKGYVVLCCLGMGLTRYLMAFYDELARSLRLRLITLDRPGVGESGPYVDEAGTPLGWPDDVAIVCNHLKVTKFSIMAHSAGAIYALATALRIPQHIRGRIHLLAPWIPPSQLSSIGSQKAPVPTNAVPYSQRILRALPMSILKVANSSFMTATSASLTSSLPKSPRRAKRKGLLKDSSSPTGAEAKSTQRLPSKITQQGVDLKALEGLKASDFSATEGYPKADPTSSQALLATSQERERQTDYDNRLTHKIWELATTNANPAVDLLVCLERRQPIGFRYVDITRNVVIHHGSRDTRVPVDNVRWLGQMMRRCEVRVLEGEGHGLMASAAVMGNVLMEIAKEWEDWMIVVQGKRRATVGTRSGIAVQA